MYWPIGAPRIYAASKHSSIARSIDSSATDDGLDTTKPVVKQNGSSPEFEQGRSPGNGNVNEKGTPSETFDSDTAAPTSQNVVDIRIARGGHVFASITETSLTVWQTKAGHSPRLESVTRVILIMVLLSPAPLLLL